MLAKILYFVDAAHIKAIFFVQKLIDIKFFIFLTKVKKAGVGHGPPLSTKDCSATGLALTSVQRKNRVVRIISVKKMSGFASPVKCNSNRKSFL